VSDTPTQRKLFTAHERRAQVIAQLHEHAVMSAQEVEARRKVVAAEIAAGIHRRKVTAWLIVAGAAFWGLAILVLGYMIAKGF
jgi:hypothetical protein